MVNTAEDTERDEIKWQMCQKLNVESCKQGKDVILTIYLTCDTKSIQLSRIYARLQYNRSVFEINAENVMPVESVSIAMTQER